MYKMKVVQFFFICNLMNCSYGINVLKVYKNIFQESTNTSKCRQQLEEFFFNFSVDTNSWALKMVDASSKVPSGMLSLNFGEFGNFQQCLDIKASTKTGQIFGKYCLGNIFSHLDTNIKTIIASFNLTLPPFLRTWALCIPDGCTADDAMQITNKFINLFYKKAPISVQFSDTFCQTEKDTHMEFTSAAVAVITLLLVLAVAALFATIYHLRSGHACPDLIKAFSIPSNASKMYKRATHTTGNVSCLCGLRVLSTVWVVLAHQYLFMTFSPVANFGQIKDWCNKRSSMYIINGPIAMITFLTIGGTATSLSFLKAQHQKHSHNFFYQVLHRYFKLFPILTVLTLAIATLSHHLATGPKWPFVEHYAQKQCIGYYGWMQFSFIQNYLHGADRMCLPHTWYLNVDLQLYLFTHLTLFCLWKYQRIFFKFLYVCIVLSIASGFYVAWKYEIAAIPSNFYGNVVDLQRKYLYATHLNAYAYLIGFLVGHFLFQKQIKNSPVKFSKYIVFTGWLVCLITLHTCLTIGFDTLRGPQYNKWGNVLHITFVRPIWCLAIGWIIVACSSNNEGYINRILSHLVFRITNIFSYGVYLVHEIFMCAVIVSMKTPDYFSDFNVKFLHFFPSLCVSYGVAVLLVFFVDDPFARIIAFALGRRNQKGKTK